MPGREICRGECGAARLFQGGVGGNPVTVRKRFGTPTVLQRFPYIPANGVWNVDREHVKGAADKVKGAIKDTAGKLTKSGTQPPLWAAFFWLDPSPLHSVATLQ